MEEVLIDNDIIPKKHELASLSSRIYASLIDFVIQILATIIFYYLSKVVFLTNIFTLLFSMLYFILLESSQRQGTFGKQLLKIKVCNYSYERINIATSFTRTIVKYFPSFLLLIVSILQYNDNGTVANAMFSSKYYWIEIIATILMLEIYSSAFFNGKKQGTHDKLAETYVIKNN
ncbi:MAG TPA: RDD family protein [Chitinophagales bacterium]|jgi:uncharacterized RDD family membrane protein YckC|nr:RDD family protein [Chitinophagales bacterium]